MFEKFVKLEETDSCAREIGANAVEIKIKVMY
jgi:hypothetical protein